MSSSDTQPPSLTTEQAERWSELMREEIAPGGATP